jgi:hypothetical protein
MSKKKKQFSAFKSELHTISPLPLEVIAARLHELEAKEVRVTMAAVDEDHIILKISHQGDGFFKKAEITGNLARWEGTYTRLDVNSRAFAYLEWLDQLGSLIRIIGLAVLTFPICGSLGTLFGGEGSGILMGIGLSFFASMVLIRQLAPLDLAKQQRYQAFKAADKLMQAITDKITEGISDDESLLEFDGSGDALNLLLHQEKFEQFRIGEDGELLE